MKQIYHFFILIALSIVGISKSYAQYFSPIPPLPSANFMNISYKGFLEGGYAFGVGNNSADILEITTSHGVSFSDIFYVGVGTGVNILYTGQFNPDWGTNYPTRSKSISTKYTNFPDYNSYRTTAVMIPLFADLRLAFGSGQIKPFVACKAGASFQVSGDVFLNDGWIDDSACLYFSPSFGVSIGLGARSALNFSICYNLITQQYYYWDDWYGPQYNEGISLNSFGARLSIEW